MQHEPGKLQMQTPIHRRLHVQSFLSNENHVNNLNATTDFTRQQKSMEEYDSLQFSKL